MVSMGNFPQAEFGTSRCCLASARLGQPNHLDAIALPFWPRCRFVGLGSEWLVLTSSHPDSRVLRPCRAARRPARTVASRIQ